jgi:CBS domain-containing protein
MEIQQPETAGQHDRPTSDRVEEEDWLDFLGRVKTDGPEELTVREFLRKMGQERRGATVMARIYEQFDILDLESVPTIDAVPIDYSVTIGPRKTSDAAVESSTDEAGHVEDALKVSRDKLPESALRIGTLASANSDPAFVLLDTTLERATTIMQRDDYSQLAVTNGHRELVGAVSWASIAIAQAWGETHKVKDALETLPLKLHPSDDLLKSVAAINVAGYAFVIDPKSGRLSGIVTSADVGKLLVGLANPYLLVGEIPACQGELRPGALSK